MSISFGRISLFIFALSLSVSALSNNGFAQDLDDVTIAGKIIDSNNAPIVGAAVTARQVETAIERTAVTDKDGVYKIIEVPPGAYNVKATASGFGAKENQGLITIAGQNVQMNFLLVPAGVQAEQTVTITEEDAPVVDTTRTVVGGTVTQREIEELPVNSRNPLDLVLTLGGTSEEALSVRDLAEDRNQNPNTPPLEQGNFSLSGGASYSNNITIDGLDNNDDRSSLDRFQPPLDAISEVQVVTNQFSSEYGRASGGRINLRTKAGSNKFRGRVFMFFRDDNFNANTWYNNSRNLPRLPFTEYNPGFTLSGPVIVPFGEGKSIYNGRNRTFFSVSYEYTDLQDTTLIDTYVPIGSNPRFSLPTSTGGQQTCDLAAANACTSNPPTAGFVAPYVFQIDTPSLRHGFIARLDHKLTDKNDFTFSWQLGRKNDKRSRFATTNRLSETIQGRISNTDALNFTNNHVFSANAVNQFRMQWSLFEPSYQTDNPGDSVVLISIRNPITNSRQTLTAGNSSVSGAGADAFAGSRRETRWQFQDSLTYIIGAHTFKSGFDIQRVNSRAVVLADSTGTFNFANALDYQNNTLSRFRQNFGDANDVENTYYGVFFNDEFKLLQNLTLNYGLRYERETALDDNNNFGPRLGIAWDPFKKGKTVIRFGAGIFYNRVLLRTVADSIQNATPNLAQFDTNTITTTNGAQANVLARIAQVFPSGFASAQDLRNLVSSVNCGTAAAPVNCSPTTGFLVNTGSAGNPLRSADPNLKIPESYQFNVGFEREIGKNFVFEANYTWNKTVRLWRDININAPILPAGYADWTAYLLANPFVLRNGGNGATSRTYRFVLGSTTDESGLSREGGGNCSTSVTNVCIVNLNTFNDSTTTPTATTLTSGAPGGSIGGPIGIARLAINQFRPDPTINDEKSFISSTGQSFYQGLVLELRSRYRKLGYGFGSSFRAAYTLSSFKDDGLNNTSNAEINGDFRREFTRNNQDRRHRFALTGVFDTPRWLGAVKLSPIFRYGSSAPFNFGIGVDRNLDDLSTDRLNFSGNLEDIVWRRPGSPFPTELLAQFSLQPIGARSGNLPRNAGRGPSLYLFDLNVSREWKFGERFKLRGNIEFDNVLNAVVFSYGAQFIDFLPNDATPTAAQLLAYQNILVPTRTYRQRQIRLGLRFDF
jgi:hypothetical protein